MTATVELTDALVVGSGYGGAIPAYYLAAGGASVVVLERGPWLTATDFTQTMRQGSNYTRALDLVVGDGVTVMAGNCVGGGSVINLAAGLRAPSFIFERQGSAGTRQWPASLTRAALDPWYDRAEKALPVSKQTWNDVSYAGGVWAAACHHTGRTCNPVPVEVDLKACTNCGWQLNGCSFDAKRSLLLNYLPAAVSYGAQIRPLHEVQTLAPATTPGYKYRISYTVFDDSGAQIGSDAIEAKVVVLAAGSLGTPVILQRSAAALGGIPSAVGKYFSTNGDHLGTYVLNESAIGSVLGLSRGPGAAPYGAAQIGRPVGSMSYDGLRADAPEFSRFALQQLYFAPMSTILSQTTKGSGPTWFGVAKKEQRRHWASMLTIMAMTEDDNEGYFGPPPASGSYTRMSSDLASNSLVFKPTANTLNGWAAADAEIKAVLADILDDGGPWSPDVMGIVSTHPLSSCRMGDNPATSALDDRHELRGLPGIFVTDGAAVPTSLCVNPSLTISALAERASTFVVRRAAQYGVHVRCVTELPAGTRTSQH